jgi:hypothetical protein
MRNSPERLEIAFGTFRVLIHKWPALVSAAIVAVSLAVIAASAAAIAVLVKLYWKLY